MKRVIVLLCCAVFVLALGVIATDKISFARSCSHTPVAYRVYVSSLSEMGEMPEDARIHNLGFCYEVCSASEILTNGTSKTMGYTTIFECDKSDVSRIFSQNSICVERKYNIEDCLVFEGYFKKSTGTFQNVQASYRNGLLSIGTPVLFGSY